MPMHLVPVELVKAFEINVYRVTFFLVQTWILQKFIIISCPKFYIYYYYGNRWTFTNFREYKSKILRINPGRKMVILNDFLQIV